MEKNSLTPGFVIAAPNSGSGKTLITLGLLRAFKNRGLSVGSFKVGPDYIDPTFHSVASEKICRNLDFWGMREETLSGECKAILTHNDIAIAEGVMGLFDGAFVGKRDDCGSTADAAKWLGWPIVLIVNASGVGESVAALIQGFRNYRSDVNIAGIILNSVNGPKHENILKDAISRINIPCLGCIPRDDRLVLPSRHLGLIRASEINEIDGWLNQAAKIIADNLDLNSLEKLAKKGHFFDIPNNKLPVPALGTHTAIARDDAFSFCYDHVVDAWRAANIKLSFFSPLEDEAPDLSADSIFLPGGYPEIHAAKLANNKRFKEAIRCLSKRNAAIYGECGGFMVLGKGLIDQHGDYHEMTGLLPIETSFENPKLHLGYREISLKRDGILGNSGKGFKGHEFHYCQVSSSDSVECLFDVTDAKGKNFSEVGCKVNSVMGSFIHIIDSV